jgi:hypothetical protein
VIIGLCGQAGSGKDTVADILVKDHHFVKVALADPLKRICREVFDFTDEQLWGASEKRNAPDKRYPRSLGDLHEGMIRGLQIPREYIHPDSFLTPRYALQQLGTEWGRDCYPNVWIDYALRVAKELEARVEYGDSWHDPQGYAARSGLVPLNENPDLPHEISGVVISDVRFRNEVDAIKKAGGKVVRIIRPGAGLEGAAAQHRSETEQSAIPAELFDYCAINDGTLGDLPREVERLLLALKTR